MATQHNENLKPLLPGATLALLAILFGFLLGGTFGAAEHSIKEQLRSSADAVFDTVYEGNEGQRDKVLSKSWSDRRSRPRFHRLSGFTRSRRDSRETLFAGLRRWRAPLLRILAGRRLHGAGPRQYRGGQRRIEFPGHPGSRSVPARNRRDPREHTEANQNVIAAWLRSQVSAPIRPIGSLCRVPYPTSRRICHANLHSDHRALPDGVVHP